MPVPYERGLTYNTNVSKLLERVKPSPITDTPTLFGAMSTYLGSLQNQTSIEEALHLKLIAIQQNNSQPVPFVVQRANERLAAQELRAIDPDANKTTLRIVIEKACTLNNQNNLAYTTFQSTRARLDRLSGHPNMIQEADLGARLQSALTFVEGNRPEAGINVRKTMWELTTMFTHLLSEHPNALDASSEYLYSQLLGVASAVAAAFVLSGNIDINHKVSLSTPDIDRFQKMDLLVVTPDETRILIAGIQAKTSQTPLTENLSNVEVKFHGLGGTIIAKNDALVYQELQALDGTTAATVFSLPPLGISRRGKETSIPEKYGSFPVVIVLNDAPIPGRDTTYLIANGLPGINSYRLEPRQNKPPRQVDVSGMFTLPREAITNAAPVMALPPGSTLDGIVTVGDTLLLICTTTNQPLTASLTTEQQNLGQAEGYKVVSERIFRRLQEAMASARAASPGRYSQRLFELAQIPTAPTIPQELTPVDPTGQAATPIPVEPTDTIPPDIIQ